MEVWSKHPMSRSWKRSLAAEPLSGRGLLFTHDTRLILARSF